MGFNKVVLLKLFEKHHFRFAKICNVDKTALITVQETGKRQCVTMCGAINTDGNNVPPLLIFLRKFFKNHMTKGAPNGTIGVASPSGWMMSQIFIQKLPHFISHAHPIQELPVLLIMDNHISHSSYTTIEIA